MGSDRPYRLHHLLQRAVWDEDAAKDAVRSFLTRHLGADGGVLIFDETGQAKKGAMTAAAGRQYSGTMGRVENVIVAVYTTYATERGHALIDRDLYVQEGWFADPDRMAAAGFPDDQAFAAKPELASPRLSERCGRDPPRVGGGRRGVRAQRRAAWVPCGSRAGGPCARVAGASAHRRR